MWRVCSADLSYSSSMNWILKEVVLWLKKSIGSHFIIISRSPTKCTESPFLHLESSSANFESLLAAKNVTGIVTHSCRHSLLRSQCRILLYIALNISVYLWLICFTGWRRERDFFDDTASIRSEGSNVRGGPRGRGKGRGRGRGRGRGTQEYPTCDKTTLNSKMDMKYCFDFK